jgi:NitT/TauT family transport system ATP-binding protein
MIKVENLTVKYKGHEALSNINLEILKGEACSILGKSGCGKTTLLLSIASLIKPTTGKIIINDKPLIKPRTKTSLVLQNYSILPWKSISQNISFILKSKGYNKAFIKQRVDEVLQSLDILEYKNRYPLELSGGQRQRSALACAIAPKPDLLLMDEPTSALDSITKESIQDLIISLKHDMSYIVVTHDIEEAVFLGKKIIVMGKGNIANIFDNPYFAKKGIRQNLDFYNYCMKIRSCLYETS